MSDPKLAEAVRIVREKLVPIWFGLPIGLALETVLAALERAQGELAACDGHGYLRAEIERLKVCVIYLEQAGRERDEARAETVDEAKKAAKYEELWQQAEAEATRLGREIVGWRGKWSATLDREARLLERETKLEAEVERLREAAQVLAGAVGDVLTGWDAHRQLAHGGGGGMGHNILIESVGRYQSIYCWGRVRKAYDAMSAVLATAQPEEPPATTYGLCVCGTCPRCFYYADGIAQAPPEEPNGRGEDGPVQPLIGWGYDTETGEVGRHWQDDAEPEPGRAQAAYQAQREREKP